MCRVCRAPFHAASAESIPINKGMMELMERHTHVLKCLTCTGEINLSTHRPKVLPCGHSFCCHCLQRCITQGRPVCGVCRAPFHVASEKAIPINRGMEDLMKKLPHATGRSRQAPSAGWFCSQPVVNLDLETRVAVYSRSCNKVHLNGHFLM